MAWLSGCGGPSELDRLLARLAMLWRGCSWLRSLEGRVRGAYEYLAGGGARLSAPASFALLLSLGLRHDSLAGLLGGDCSVASVARRVVEEAVSLGLGVAQAGIVLLGLAGYYVVPSWSLCGRGGVYHILGLSDISVMSDLRCVGVGSRHGVDYCLCSRSGDLPEEGGECSAGCCSGAVGLRKVDPGRLSSPTTRRLYEYVVGVAGGSTPGLDELEHNTGFGTTLKDMLVDPLGSDSLPSWTPRDAVPVIVYLGLPIAILDTNRDDEARYTAANLLLVASIHGGVSLGSLRPRVCRRASVVDLVRGEVERIMKDVPPATPASLVGLRAAIRAAPHVYGGGLRSCVERIDGVLSEIRLDNPPLLCPPREWRGGCDTYYNFLAKLCNTTDPLRVLELSEENCSEEIPCRDVELERLSERLSQQQPLRLSWCDVYRFAVILASCMSGF